MAEMKTCFVIAPIDKPYSTTRNRSDQVLKHIFRPAAKKCGYTIVRADEDEKPGLITYQIIQHITGDDLVIADLTGQNPNVFYELALRHAVNKPLILVADSGEQLPFDIADCRTVWMDWSLLDCKDLARAQIVEQIRAVESGNMVAFNPISSALDLQAIHHSKSPMQRTLAQLVETVSVLRFEMMRLERRLPPRKIDLSPLFEGKTPEEQDEMLYRLSEEMKEMPNKVLEELRKRNLLDE